MDQAELRRVVAGNIRRLAAQRKLSLNHVADRAPINRASLYRILGCEVSPTLATIGRLAEVFEVPPRELLDERKVPEESAAKKLAAKRS